MPKINELWAYLSEERPGEEGVVACPMMIHGQLVMMPLVCADADRATALQPMAQEAAETSGRPIRLVRFTAREEVRVMTPSKKDVSQRREQWGKTSSN